jgi:hypothetical protein
MGRETIAIRISSELKEKLQKEAENRTDVTLSQTARIALQEWVDTRWIKRSDLISIPRSNYAFLLEILNETQLSQFEDQIAQKVNNYFQYLIVEHREMSQNLTYFIKEMIKFIGIQGLNWFDQIDFESQFNKTPQYFKGIHNMGKKWSEVFFGIFNKIVKLHSVSFKIKENSKICSDSLVYMEFEHMEKN